MNTITHCGGPGPGLSGGRCDPKRPVLAGIRYDCKVGPCRRKDKVLGRESDQRFASKNLSKCVIHRMVDDICFDFQAVELYQR